MPLTGRNLRRKWARVVGRTLLLLDRWVTTRGIDGDRTCKNINYTEDAKLKLSRSAGQDLTTRSTTMMMVATKMMISKVFVMIMVVLGKKRMKVLMGINNRSLVFTFQDVLLKCVKWIYIFVFYDLSS